MHGPLDTEAFRDAWQALADRHGVLRSAFAWSDLPAPVQIVSRHAEVAWIEEDWRDTDAVEQERRLAAFLEADCRRGFALDRAPLWRVALLRLGPRTHALVWSYHHAIIDAWCRTLLIDELVTLYAARCTKTSPPLPVRRPYRDYIAWLLAQDRGRAETYWREALAGFNAPTPIGIDRSGASRTGVGERTHRWSPDEVLRLEQAARAQKVTLNTLFQGAWALLLGRYSGEADVLFGATVAGRATDLPGAASMVGLFINTLPVRVNLEAEPSVSAFLLALQRQQAEARQFEYAALTDIQGWSAVPRGVPLFESLFVFENHPNDDALPARTEAVGLRLDDWRRFEHTHYPLTCEVTPGAELRVRLSYQRSRFEDGAIDRLLDHFATILRAMVDTPERSPGELPMLTPAEHRLIVVDWNATADDAGLDEPIHALIARQAERTPDAIAVTDDDGQLTYAALDARAARLAAVLRRAGVGPDVCVGICAERSLALVCGLLAILKAGGAYVPLDPENPPERLRLMLDEAAAQVVLCQEHLLSRLPATTPTAIGLERGWQHLDGEPVDECSAFVGGDQLAYVIYTSGSTGQPKGAMNTHRGIVNRLRVDAGDVRTDLRGLRAAEDADRVRRLGVGVLLAADRRRTARDRDAGRPSRSRLPRRRRSIRERITTVHFVPSMLPAFLEAPRELRGQACAA